MRCEMTVLVCSVWMCSRLIDAWQLQTLRKQNHIKLTVGVIKSTLIIIFLRFHVRIIHVRIISTRYRTDRGKIQTDLETTSKLKRIVVADLRLELLL